MRVARASTDTATADLLRRLRSAQERLLATLARPPAEGIPPYHRLRAACDHLLLLGAALAAKPRRPASASETIQEQAARVTLELALLVAPEGRSVGTVLDHLATLQAVRRPVLVRRPGALPHLGPQRPLGLAFEGLARMLALLGQGREPSRLGPLAADVANRVTVAAFGTERPGASATAASPAPSLRLIPGGR